MRFGSLAVLLLFVAAPHVAAQSPRELEMRRAVEQRIAAAARWFEAWVAATPADEVATVLVSFSEHLSLPRMRALLDPSRMPPGPDDVPPPAERARQARAKAALEAARSEAAQGHARFTGILLRARRDALQDLARRGAREILAIEPMPPSGSSFAITIDEYRIPSR